MNAAQPVSRFSKLVVKVHITNLIRLGATTALVVGSVLALSACTAVKVKLGLRVRLDKLPITSMQASLPNGPAISPGEKSPLVVRFTQPDGKVLVTEGKGKGKVLWSDLAVSPTLVTVDKKGVVALRHDPRYSDGKSGHVAITVPSHPDLHSDFDIPVTYDYNFIATFNGGTSSGNAATWRTPAPPG